jgi:hypothetical protein
MGRVEVVIPYQPGSHMRLGGRYTDATRLIERARADVRPVQHTKSGSERSDDRVMLFGRA